MKRGNGKARQAEVLGSGAHEPLRGTMASRRSMLEQVHLLKALWPRDKESLYLPKGSAAHG